MWHTTAIVWWSRLCRVCSASMSQSWYHAHSASIAEYDTNLHRAQLSAHLTEQEASAGSADLQIGGCRVRRAASHRWTQLAKGVRPWSGHVPMPPTAQSPAAKDLVGAQ